MSPENASLQTALPPLELLRGFEAAARHLSFTQAAAELHLTQSAVSRQVQQLEASVGVLLFERRHRALALTDAGRILQRAVEDSLERLRDATARLGAAAAAPPRQVAITCTPGFASFWLIPRLARFSAAHGEVDVRVSATLEVQSLERQRLDLAVRFVPVARGNGVALFEESVMPVCAPALAARLRTPADLTDQTLLTIDAPGHGEMPTIDWQPWLQVMGLAGLRMKNNLRFSHYTDAVAAAVAGQGVVIGRLPLLRGLLEERRLVAPFGQGATSQRGYFLEIATRAARNQDAQDFARWLRHEAKAWAVGANEASTPEEK